MPAHYIGDAQQFCLEIEPIEDDPRGRVVDIWAAGHLLTCDGNRVYVPQFCHDVEAVISWLLSEPDLRLPFPELSPQENHRRIQAADLSEGRSHRFLAWGPTTDNLRCFIFSRGSDMLITFEFWRESHSRPSELGQIYLVEISERKLLLLLHQTACILRRDI